MWLAQVFSSTPCHVQLLWMAIRSCKQPPKAFEMMIRAVVIYLPAWSILDCRRILILLIDREWVGSTAVVREL